MVELRSNRPYILFLDYFCIKNDVLHVLRLKQMLHFDDGTKKGKNWGLVTFRLGKHEYVGLGK